MDKNYWWGLKCGVGTDTLFIDSTSFFNRHNLFLGFLLQQEPVFLIGNSPTVSEPHNHCHFIIAIPHLLS
jgi:hypothetical protein